MPRALLIDTDPQLHSGLRKSVILEECELELAAGDADALLRLRRRSFDAVITSPLTTVDEDLALVEEMRRVRPGIKTIILARHATPEDVIAAVRARVFACFSAPFEPVEIADMVRQAIEASDWRDGIEVVSAHRDWISVRAASRILTAERLVHFLSELESGLPGAEKEGLMFAFREILINAMEHGAGFDPEKMVEVSAVRTARTIVFYVRDPGPGFWGDALAHAAVSNPEGDPMAHDQQRVAQGMRGGGFGLLLARKIVDEMIYSEVGNEVLLIKYTR